MALDSIPPWLDVHPGQFVQAMEQGNRTGLELANLVQRGQMSADELAQNREKMALTQSEGAAERALRQNLQQHAQELAQQKFSTNVALREAGQEIQRARQETAAHAAIIQAMQRQKNEEDLKKYRESEQSDRLTGLDIAKQRLQLEKDRPRSGGLRETVRIPAPSDELGLTSGPQKTYSGSPADVEARLKAESAPSQSPAPSAPGKSSGKPAEGGYKIGWTYTLNGTPYTYLGGPVNDPSSFQQNK